MGLDMYLTATRFVNGYAFADGDERELYRTLVAAAGAESIIDPETPAAEISLTCAYWRKANQIHAWFVDHVQGGVDDCGTYEVERGQLEELVSRCELVLAHTELVPGSIANGYVLKETPDGGYERVPVMEEGKTIADPALAQELLPTAEGFFFGSEDYDEWYVHGLWTTVEQVERVLEVTRGQHGRFGFDLWTFKYHAW